MKILLKINSCQLSISRSLFFQFLSWSYFVRNNWREKLTTKKRRYARKIPWENRELTDDNTILDLARECSELFCISNWKARRKNRLVENGKKVGRDIELNGMTWESEGGCEREENREFYSRRQSHRQGVANLIYRQWRGRQWRKIGF